MTGSRTTSRSLHRAASQTRIVLVAGVVLMVAFTVGGSLLLSGPDNRLMLRATFGDASPLLEGNDVRLGGVKVGTVASMRVVEGGAEVMIELEESALPVHEDARLTIRPVSLLGERYVELDRGSPDAPVMADGAHLALDQTGSAVDLDEVLNTLDDPTAEGLATLVGTLGVGLDGNGEDVKRAIAALAPALSDTGRLTKTLRKQNTTLSSLVDSLSQVASGIAIDGDKQLDRLVTAAEIILAQTTANETAFRSMFEELPSTIHTAVRTLRNLEGTADAATPTLRALRPTTRDLEEISNELLDFAAAADPALAAANPVLEEADSLVEAARPVAQLLRQQAPSIRRDAIALDPITRDLIGDFKPVVEFIRGWALATNGKDGLSHYFRAGLVLSEYSVTGLLPGGPQPDTDSNGPPSQQPDPSDDTPASPPTQQPPLVPDLVDGVDDLLGGLLSQRTDRTGGVTGLTPRQETQALDFLLGGS